MLKTTDLLDRLKATYHLPSDYATAKKLGISRSAISKYRKNAGSFDDSIAVEVAELLELEPLQVLASMYIERAERLHDEKLISIWRKYAA